VLDRPGFIGLSDSPAVLRAAGIFYLAHVLFLPGVTPTEIGLALAFFAMVVAWWRDELALTFHEAYVPIALFAIASLASALAAPDPLRSLRQATDVWILLAFPVGLVLLRAIPRLAASVFAMLVIMASVQAVIGVVQFLQSEGVLERRITGTTSHVMTLAGLLLAVSLLALIHGIERGRWLEIAAGGLCSVALALSLTRSAWIGWIAGLLLYLVVRRPRWLAVLVPAAILVITLSPLALFGRLVSSFDPGQSSNLDRIRMVQAGVEMIRDHPLLGMGPGNVRPNYPIYRLPDAPRFSVPHLHSNPVQIWAERGVVALFAYGLLILLVLRDCAAGVRRGGESAAWGLGAGAAVIGLTVAGLFEFNFGDSEVLLCLLAVAALAVARIEAAATDA
jgi:putative inorganic carbon (hco3(-)) transporter